MRCSNRALLRTALIVVSLFLYLQTDRSSLLSSSSSILSFGDCATLGEISAFTFASESTLRRIR